MDLSIDGDESMRFELYYYAPSDEDAGTRSLLVVVW